MTSPFELKEQPQTETPVLLFTCALRDGTTERWSSHRLEYQGNLYEARVLRHNVFEMQAASEQGVDAIPKMSVSVANVDGRLSQLERATGFKGSVLTVSFVFFDLRAGTAASEELVLFQGVLNPPEEITEQACRITAVNRMALQRVLLPEVRIQRRCPWRFPATAAERVEGVDGGPFSRFHRCGYSADAPGGVGNLDASSQPFTSCAYTREDCEARGMFSKDSSNRTTARFGGVEFVPASTLVRGHGSKEWSASTLVANEAKYNDPVPLVYGTVWYTAPIVFSRNDGNLTRIEALLGLGEIEGVHKVLVNRVEIPLGQSGKNMTGTGWYNVVSLGNRQGGFNLDFRDAAGNPLGDPYGSMAYLSVVVPNQVSDGKSAPKVEVLADGLKVSQFDEQGQWTGDVFTRNPVWMLMDVLRRSGWKLSEIDVASFARAASYCDQEILATDLDGSLISIPRYEASFVLKTRKSAAEVVRGIRANARLLLMYGPGGVLEVKPESTIAIEHPEKPVTSNATSTVNDGWPCYEFGDGSNGTSGILRTPEGAPTVRVTSRTTADTPNRFGVEFQDRFNSYQQDSMSLVDVEDVERTNQEISGTCHAIGIGNFSQASRVLKQYLDKSVGGNTYVEFETTVRALGLRPGDLIAVTYLREGFLRQLFRVLRVLPGVNYRTARLFAQIHRDGWYVDAGGLSLDGQTAIRPAIGLPRPVAGTNGGELGIEERLVTESDGRAVVELSVDFTAPPAVAGARAGMPTLSLSPVVETGGSIAPGQILYYSISGLDANGVEGPLSFTVRAAIPSAAGGYRVRLTGIRASGETQALHIYRGESPWHLRRIASDVAAGSTFEDAGNEVLGLVPPDASYHHTNVSWRIEQLPETPATLFSEQSVGNGSLTMAADEYRGYVARITGGRGAGQEQTIAGNDATRVFVANAWQVAPDASSIFCIAESGWQAGGSGAASPVRIQVPNRAGETVHVRAVSANALNQESPAALAPVSRWMIGGAGLGGGDDDVPPRPEFAFSVMSNGGGVELAGISFPTLENTRSVTSGVLQLHYYDELDRPGALELENDMDTETDVVSFTATGASIGDYVQVGREVLALTEELVVGTSYRAVRGALGTMLESHSEGDAGYRLLQHATSLSFPRDFFGSPASGRWTQAITLPTARIAAAELYVTNAIGDSETRAVGLTQTSDSGLRTMSGGQYSFSIEGFLAVEDGATPEIVVDRRRSVRDVYAVVRSAPYSEGGSPPLRMELRNSGQLLCALEIASGGISSAVVDGFTLPVLEKDSRLSLNITSVGYTVPGADLTVTVRL